MKRKGQNKAVDSHGRRRRMTSLVNLKTMIEKTMADLNVHMNTWVVMMEQLEEQSREKDPDLLQNVREQIISLREIMQKEDLELIQVYSLVGQCDNNVMSLVDEVREIKRHSIHGMMEEENVVRPHQEMAQLSLDEKKFLLAVERGDVATTRRMLQKAMETNYINMNCVDPLGRTALLMAIDNENPEMVELLIKHRVETKDALLHAISEEFVEAVEALLEHEESIAKPGQPASWEALPPDTATFTPDITPLILAAHRDNYEIIKILLDRGATLPMPHAVRCGCDECVTSRHEDSLRHSRSRIHAYRALASPSLIALSSKDPILTAFELSWELRRLSFMEHEFKTEYQVLSICGLCCRAERSLQCQHSYQIYVNSQTYTNGHQLVPK